MAGFAAKLETARKKAMLGDNLKIFITWASISLCIIVFVYVGIPWIYGRTSRLLLRRKAVKSKAVVLTFDDGPGGRMTPAILNILEQYNAKATFFLLGRNIVGREGIVRQIAKQGHEICSHGYDHLHYWKASPFRTVMDVKRGWNAIDTALGTCRGVYLFRPPYGKLNLICLFYLWIHRVPVVYWSLILGDIYPPNKWSIKRAALLAKKVGGAVILAHDFDRPNKDIDDKVLKSLTETLVMAKEEGMSIVTVSELLRMK